MDKIKILWCWAPVPCIPKFFPPDKVEVNILGMIVPPPPEEELMRLAADVEFILVRRYFQITRNVINATKHLKMIQRMGRPTDNIDVAAAKEAGIHVAILPMSLDMAVAEHVIMFMLALPKMLVRAHNSVVNGDYEKFGLSPTVTTEAGGLAENWTQLPGDNVYHKTLGIIGMGDIGTAVAERAKCFGMTILYHKRRRLGEDEERRLGIHYTTLQDLLRKADFVCPLVPHTEETDKMLGREEFAMMKPTAYLINVSRGGVIDEEALYEGLKNKVIAGAGLDVFEKEPTPKDNPLLRLDNVILTPHIASTWPHGRPILYDVQRASENIFRVAKGEKPIHGNMMIP
jgi:lactate dehydrogenase-like 2-hydroxyacid dehydrogenase